MTSASAAVVGAGVVGLATAVALARTGREVVLLEAAARPGAGTSSRNSGVIHAGLYYTPGSLKARLCVEGRERLYAYCAARGIPHRQTGKLIVAGSAKEIIDLDRIAIRAEAAGAGSLRLLEGQEARSLEPQLGCHAALYSPRSGIVDVHSYVQSLEAELADLGGLIAYNTVVTGAERRDALWRLRVEGEAGEALTVNSLVNSAGLRATQVAATIAGLEPGLLPQPIYARGCYFAYAKPVPFTHLIYPVPVPGGLGTHLTLDLEGRARFGPNVEWIGSEDYTIDPELHAEFVVAARKIMPGLDPEALHPDYAGIRPKVRTATGLAEDFIVQDEREHGLPGLINLFGIESPGLTASLSLGQEVAARL